MKRRLSAKQWSEHVSQHAASKQPLAAYWYALQTETIENPRFLRNELVKLAELQRQRARKKKDSSRYRRLTLQIGKLHEYISNCRKDFLHKETSKIVSQCSLIATEELAPKNMTRSARGSKSAPGRRVKQKSGLNREILSAGFGMAHQMLSYKVTEKTGTKLHLSNTRHTRLELGVDVDLRTDTALSAIGLCKIPA